MYNHLRNEANENWKNTSLFKMVRQIYGVLGGGGCVCLFVYFCMFSLVIYDRCSDNKTEFKTFTGSISSTNTLYI